jgi:hypothetical protein
VLDIVSVPKGNTGQFFMSALSVNNSGTGGLNFLEGCYHMYVVVVVLSLEAVLALERYDGRSMRAAHRST